MKVDLNQGFGRSCRPQNKYKSISKNFKKIVFSLISEKSSDRKSINLILYYFVFESVPKPFLAFKFGLCAYILLFVPSRPKLKHCTLNYSKAALPRAVIGVFNKSQIMTAAGAYFHQHPFIISRRKWKRVNRLEKRPTSLGLWAIDWFR